MDSPRLTGIIRVNRTHHDTGMVGPQSVESDEVFAVERQHRPPFRTRKGQDLDVYKRQHMFFAEDRIAHMQAMILARDEKNRRKALLKLLPMQRKDFAGLFTAMDRCV